MSAAGGAGTISVKQVKSGIGYNEIQNKTLRALGLGKIGRVRELPDNEAVRGMLFRVRHLVEVSQAGQES